MAFTIAFDPPEGEALFPRCYPATVGALTPSLSYATRFETEQAAEDYLASDDVSFSMRQWGVVVEVGE